MNAVDDLVSVEPAFLAAVCGRHDSHLTLIEARTGAALFALGNAIRLEGGEGARAQARAVITEVLRRVMAGESLGVADVELACRIAGLPGPVEAADRIALALPRRTIRPRTDMQAAYLRSLRTDELVFGIGPAGTGKTYLAVAHAAYALLRGEVERLILSRPAVEAGERIGFLPGDMKDKVDPYMRPLYDSLYDVMAKDVVDRRIAGGDIEIAPLAFMRGRTLSRAMIILDEAQNATIPQMRMFLTRLGEGSRMVVTGDPTQTDLPDPADSGLADAIGLLPGIAGVGITMFSGADVVRHRLVREIVAAYERRGHRADGATVIGTAGQPTGGAGA